MNITLFSLHVNMSGSSHNEKVVFNVSSRNSARVEERSAKDVKVQTVGTDHEGARSPCLALPTTLPPQQSPS